MTISQRNFYGGVTPSAVADLLDRTADYISTHRWTRGKRERTNTGGVCAVGGLCKVANGNPYVDNPLTWAARDTLYDVLGTSIMGINDGCRDKRKVVRAMRRTAKAVRKQFGVTTQPTLTQAAA